jgi:GntR family transcriptional regulator
MGRSTTVRLLSFGYAPAPGPVAAALALGPRARCQVSQRVRLIDGAPFSHRVTQVPEAIGRSYAEADLATTPLLSLLERSGITVARATQTMTATLATPEVAAALDVAVGAPLLSVTRAVFDTTGRGVEHLAALYRPDRYAFRMDLLREGAPDARTWQPMFTQPDQSTDAVPNPRTTGSPEP